MKEFHAALTAGRGGAKAEMKEEEEEEEEEKPMGEEAPSVVEGAVEAEETAGIGQAFSQVEGAGKAEDTTDYILLADPVVEVVYADDEDEFQRKLAELQKRSLEDQARLADCKLDKPFRSGFQPCPDC